MSRIVCVWFPNWPLQRLRHERPELNGRPLVIYSLASHRGSCVVMCSAAAAQQGVAPGMPLAEAEALVCHAAITASEMHFERADATADVIALREVARTCDVFTPLFGLEESESPECLLMDVAGCEHLFGGAQNLVDAIASDFRQRGFQVRAALAPTIGAAWAAARFLAQPNQQPVLDDTQLRIALAPLPVVALRLPRKTVETLRELGLNGIGQLRALPRASLPARFGPELLKRLDQAFGDEPEWLTPERPPEPIAATWATEEPFSDRESLRLVCRELLDQLVGRLKPRREGVRQLLCQIKDASGRPTEFTVGLVAASDVTAHLLELLSLKLERAALPEAVAFVRLEATHVASLAVRQRDLFGFETDSDTLREVHTLLDRLSSRLGTHAVVRARLVPDAQPELAIRQEPVAANCPLVGRAFQPDCRAGKPDLLEPHGSQRDVRSADQLPPPASAAACRCEPPRPLRMFAAPQPIEVSVAGPEGAPLHFRWDRRDLRVIRSWGPERIETGWWRDEPIRRDYFRVEVQTGHRFWLFRCLHRLTWFIHGAFD